MTEIEKESRTLNSQRLHQIQQTVDEDSQRLHQVQHRVEEIQREGRETNEGVEGRRAQCDILQNNVLTDGLASQKKQEAESLSVLRNKLLRDGPDPTVIVNKYSSELREGFKNSGRLSVLNVDQLVDNAAFRQWEDSRKSSIMLLQGKTAITTRDYSFFPGHLSPC